MRRGARVVRTLRLGGSLAAAVLLVVALSGCGSSSDEKTSTNDPASGRTFCQAALPLRELPAGNLPIGGILGFTTVTHRGIISSITPIVLPSANARQLNARVVQQIRSGSFDIYQLDATAYPGNSGGPLYETTRGEVIGIINMVFVKESKESVLSKPSGISFAIPVRYLRELMAQNH